jgi:hypothetical protein
MGMAVQSLYENHARGLAGDWAGRDARKHLTRRRALQVRLSAALPWRNLLFASNQNHVPAPTPANFVAAATVCSAVRH